MTLRILTALSLLLTAAWGVAIGYAWGKHTTDTEIQSK